MSQAVDPADGVEVADRFRATRFDGASGDVQFDAVGDREESSISFVCYNWVVGADGESIRSNLASTLSLSGDLQPVA
eukprot:4246758-Prymnesium_polylepis.1